MADKDYELKLESDEELEARLQSEADTSETESEEEPYEGPERRVNKERRAGPGDRREMMRFEPEKGKADRREGRDRRKANNRPEDLWKQRDI